MYNHKTMPAKKTSAPKRQRKTKATVAETSAPAPVEVSAPAPVEVAAPAVETTTESTSTNQLPDWTAIETSFADLNTRLQEFKTFYSSLLTDVRTLQKNVQRYLRDSTRKNRRRKRVRDPNAEKRAPSGFAKPALISNELCTFLGKPKGTEMARTEVTKYLTTYIKTNDLQDSANRRKIIPDKKLQKLLNVTASDEVTYFNLQKYMKIHFPKPASQASA